MFNLGITLMIIGSIGIMAVTTMASYNETMKWWHWTALIFMIFPWIIVLKDQKLEEK